MYYVISLVNFVLDKSLKYITLIYEKLNLNILKMLMKIFLIECNSCYLRDEYSVNVAYIDYYYSICILHYIGRSGIELEMENEKARGIMYLCDIFNYAIIFSRYNRHMN